jgi:nucleoside-diphosphate-sugar epimerase
MGPRNHCGIDFKGGNLILTTHRVLVTGAAAGFLGSHLCDALLAQGHHVVGVDNFAHRPGRQPHYSDQ